jgi:F-type H+-transporting ATPase subunit a
MTAGHVVILSMLGLIFLLKAWLVVPISVGFALFIFLLELLIAFIQAYIFAVLTTVFINLSRHPH